MYSSSSFPVSSPSSRIVDDDGDDILPSPFPFSFPLIQVYAKIRPCSSRRSSRFRFCGDSAALLGSCHLLAPSTRHQTAAMVKAPMATPRMMPSATSCTLLLRVMVVRGSCLYASGSPVAI
ncbi:hypothetical protein PG996_001198 [Apiospora saccharicola]|uniref:Uncharacterized protein n=1 Tax=Apiospora saccharicola TaxID=335842 RepID=A0ABR1WHF4_9PEZI